MSHVTLHRRRFSPPPLAELRRMELPPQVRVPGRRRHVAALLAFTTGWAGGHKLYLMRFEQALVSLAFCWTLIPALVALAEGVTFLLMTDEEFAETYTATSSWTCRLWRVVFRQPTRPARGYEFKPYRPW